MTRKEREKVEKHFDELHEKTEITLPTDIRQALKAAYIAGADYAIDMFAPRWISVEDELPERGEDVLILTPQNLINIAAYEYRGLESKVPVFVSGIDGYSWRNVTHWQRLPQPPSSSEIPNNFKKGGEQ